MSPIEEMYLQMNAAIFPFCILPLFLSVIYGVRKIRQHIMKIQGFPVIQVLVAFAYLWALLEVPEESMRYVILCAGIAFGLFPVLFLVTKPEAQDEA